MFIKINYYLKSQSIFYKKLIVLVSWFIDMFSWLPDMQSLLHIYFLFLCLPIIKSGERERENTIEIADGVCQNAQNYSSP